MTKKTPIQNRWKKDAKIKEKAKNQTQDAREQRLLNLIEIRSKNIFPNFNQLLKILSKLNFPFLLSLFGKKLSFFYHLIIDSYMSGIGGERTVRAIDAASVSERVSVSEDGIVK